MRRAGKSFAPSDPRVETYDRAYDFFRQLVAAMTEVYPHHASSFSAQNTS